MPPGAKTTCQTSPNRSSATQLGTSLEGELKHFQEWLHVWEQETAETGGEDLVEELEQAEGQMHKEKTDWQINRYEYNYDYV